MYREGIKGDSEIRFTGFTFLENQGYTVLRFPEYLVVYRIDEVITEIDYSIKCIEKQIEEKN